MSVYVDDMYAPYGRMKMCHMIADTTDELLAMADKIGVARRWIQHPGAPREHFDICMAKKAKALALGAIHVTQRDMVRIRNRREPSEEAGRKENVVIGK